MNTSQTVSETVAAMVRAWGHTPTDVSLALGRSSNWLNNKLAGRVNWSIPDVEAVAQQYGVSPLDLLRGPEHIVAKMERAWTKLPAALRPKNRPMPTAPEKVGQLELEGAA